MPGSPRAWTNSEIKRIIDSIKCKTIKSYITHFNLVERNCSTIDILFSRKCMHFSLVTFFGLFKQLLLVSYFSQELHFLLLVLDTSPSIIVRMDHVRRNWNLFFTVVYPIKAIRKKRKKYLTVEINSAVPIHIDFFNHILDWKQNKIGLHHVTSFLRCY